MLRQTTDKRNPLRKRDEVEYDVDLITAVIRALLQITKSRATEDQHLNRLAHLPNYERSLLKHSHLYRKRLTDN